MENPIPNESALDLIEYPSRFPLMVFGGHSDDFEELVLGLIKARSPQSEHFEVTRRSSKAGKYLSLTITFTVHSRQQLEDIYRDLHECEQVLMSL